MEEYRIECPICSSPTKTQITIPDTSVVYHVEGFEAQPGLLWTMKRPNPEAERGANILINRSLMETEKLECDEDHYLVARHCHYGEIDDESTMLLGPAEKPDVRCPSCEFKLGDHADYIYRLARGEENQYILRTITEVTDESYQYVGAVTRSSVGGKNQVSTIEKCPGCGLDIHFNYSNKVYKKKEKFEGFKRQHTN